MSTKVAIIREEPGCKESFLGFSPVDDKAGIGVEFILDNGLRVKIWHKGDHMEIERPNWCSPLHIKEEVLRFR